MAQPKVNGWSEPGQFIGREIRLINVAGLAACPALPAAWPELDAAIAAIELYATVEQVGDFVETDTEVNLLISGMTYGATDYVDGTVAFFDFLETVVDPVIAGTPVITETVI